MEDQVVTLEKELESATEAGLELERMLRELLSSNKEDNPLAQSVEDLQARLNAQQAENEALTNALNLKKQEVVDDINKNQACERFYTCYFKFLISISMQLEFDRLEVCREKFIFVFFLHFSGFCV